MTRTVEALVTQVIEYDDLDRYAIPPEIRENVAPDEDLVNVNTDPHSGAVHWALTFAPIAIPIRVIVLFLRLIPILGSWLGDLLDAGPERFVVDHGAVDVGEWITVDLEEAVVEETRTRSGVDDREVWLYEGAVLDRGDRS